MDVNTSAERELLFKSLGLRININKKKNYDLIKIKGKKNIKPY